MKAQNNKMKQSIYRLFDAATTSRDFRKALIEQLRELLPFDAACCTTVDPETLLSTGAVTEMGIEAIHDHLFEYEYLREDFNKYELLVQEDIPVAILSMATTGELERSSRYREVLQPAGFADEMRAALIYEGKCWGYLTLFRRHLFTEIERKLLNDLIPAIASCLRTTSLFLPEDAVTRIGQGPGIMVLSDQLKSFSANQAAKQWLTLIQQWENIDSRTLPRPIRAVCSRLLSQSIGNAMSSDEAKVSLCLPDLPCVTIRASRLHGSVDSIAVWMEQATPSEMLPMIADAYGLTKREKEIISELVTGASTKEVAHTLHISTYTVQDHLKSIFAKTGVASRRELIWQLFSRFSCV
ncbi:helix-turn-helix transcriptional regulator [Paenibacillus lentus]|uniref:LuxR family transcriptional regulator n=1 Tax=Paenibacillus lentus TaxID=1338368 RepID=A0A3Q8SD22_9BACL|nr:helix-turn-helix transcriptional regulator [Paenibacillus lentus]AZK47881.1 LuxR family transcriptional regulator [Paenibacillus lentus]